MIDQSAIDELFDVLNRYIRLRERAVHTTFRTADGEFETAAFKGLFHLARQPMRSRELADSLNADPSTVSRHVAALVGLGLLRREADPDDGRATLLVITDAGRERVEAMRDVRRAAMDRAMSDWTDDDVWTLVSLLGRFVDAAEDVVPTLRPGSASGADSPGADDLVKGQS